MNTVDESSKANSTNTLSTPTVASDLLFSGGKTLLIQHGEDVYRLQLTKSRKLILTK